MKQLSIFTVFFILLLSSSSYGNTIKVCNSCNYKSLTVAVKNAIAYDTILVKKGTYYEFNIEITKALTIIGEGNPVIDGQNKGEIITIQADDVTIDGLTIVNVGTSYTTDFAAVRVVKSENFILQNLKLERLFFGIYLEKCKNGKVLNNTIIGDAVNEYSSGNGIQLWYCRNIVVRGNKIKKVRDGIYLEFSDDITIHENGKLFHSEIILIWEPCVDLILKRFFFR
jgi:nitrous oxidase accessory protein